MEGQGEKRVGRMPSASVESFFHLFLSLSFIPLTLRTASITKSSLEHQSQAPRSEP